MRAKNFEWILMAMTASALAACSADWQTGDDDLVSAEIVRGRADGERHPSVVALMIGEGGLCTGTLIAPRAVLTARHCVSELASEGIDCADPSPQFEGDLDPRTIAVRVGNNVSSAREVAHGVRALVPAGDRLCEADIAVLLLDRDVTGIDPVPVSLTQAPRAGDDVVLVGYGRRSEATGAGIREYRTAVPIVRVAAREFLLGRSTCSGDSGGPALDARSGAVVGVVSRGGPTCTSTIAHNYFSRVDAWASLVREGIRLGGGDERDGAGMHAPIDHSGDVPADMGSACHDGSECSSGSCIRSRGVCTMTCDADTPCPMGWYCGLGSGGVRACFYRG